MTDSAIPVAKILNDSVQNKISAKRKFLSNQTNQNNVFVCVELERPSQQFFSHVWTDDQNKPDFPVRIKGVNSFLVCCVVIFILL